MNAREERGLIIASNQRLIQKGLAWLVPSQTGNGRKYTVIPDEKEPHCTCPDHEAGHVCKHIYAVRFTMTKVEQNPDGSATVTTVTVQAEQRKTYAQPDWSAYHASQVNEYAHFQVLLADLCAALPETPRKPGRGRKPVTYRDGLFAAIFKTYSLVSARRFSGQLAEAHQHGYMEHVPHFNSVLNVFDNADVTPLLKGMVEASALPLNEVETNFATDSTGFSGSSYHKWFDKKWGSLKQELKWVKAHFTTGVLTNVVTAVDVLAEDTGDCPQMPKLVDKTAEGFTIDTMSADKAYAAEYNFQAVEKHGGTFYPMFRHNAKGSKPGSSFAKTLHYFGLHRDEYLAKYHQRSNIESTVSMIKRKFGNGLRSKNDTSMRNETYAKFVCHNLCVLVQEMYVMGIDPTFGRCTNLPEPAHLLAFPRSYNVQSPVGALRSLAAKRRLTAR